MVNILKLLTTFYKWLFNKKEKKEKEDFSAKKFDNKIWIKPDEFLSARRSAILPSSQVYKYRKKVNFIVDINGEKCYEGDVIIYNHQYIILGKEVVIYARINIKIIKAEDIDLNYYITKEKLQNE